MRRFQAKSRTTSTDSTSSKRTAGNIKRRTLHLTSPFEISVLLLLIFILEKQEYNRVNGFGIMRKVSLTSRSSTRTTTIFSSAIPKHVAFICDGNSRWAQERGLPTALGHAKGAERLVQVLEALQERGPRYCTMYAFSTENWKRSDREIDELFRTMEQSLLKFEPRAKEENVRIRVIGDWKDPRIPKSFRDALERVQNETHDCIKTDSSFTICLAINYGGRQDILQAVQALIDEKDRSPSELTMEDLSKCLSTHSIPDPDLVIRTGGECRLSNFLLWNVAYAELYFCDTYWPDFGPAALDQALAWYETRQRRFGGRQPSILSTSRRI